MSVLNMIPIILISRRGAELRKKGYKPTRKDKIQSMLIFVFAIILSFLAIYSLIPILNK